jgi:hypothetical protein
MKHIIAIAILAALTGCAHTSSASSDGWCTETLYGFDGLPRISFVKC